MPLRIHLAPTLRPCGSWRADCTREAKAAMWPQPNNPSLTTQNTKTGSGWDMWPDKNQWDIRLLLRLLGKRQVFFPTKSKIWEAPRVECAEAIFLTYTAYNWSLYIKRQSWFMGRNWVLMSLLEPWLQLAMPGLCS